VPNIYNFLTQIRQFAPSFHVIEVRKGEGDTLEFRKVTIRHAKIMPINARLKGTDVLRIKRFIFS
jgi:hypothetical protein